MRIGLVSPYSFDVPGGVQLHVRDLATYLLAEGHEVSVLAPSDGDDAGAPYVTSAGGAMPIRYNGSVARLAFGPVAASRTARWVERGDFDVLHVHEPMTPSVSLLALRTYDGPVVATFHTSIERSRALQLAQPFLRPALEKITGRIAVSRAARDTVARHLGGDAALVPNGVYVDRFATARPEARWQDGGERPTIAFLGRMGEPRKGLRVLLDAVPLIARAHPGVRVLVAGPGDVDAARREVPASAEGHVEFLGLLSDTEKASLLASCDAYVAPNTGGESFGIILIEAMSAGAPVVASDLEAFARVLDDGRCGVLFDTGDAAALAHAVTGVLADRGARDALSRAGRERARLYDWSAVGQQVISAYETVRSSHAAAAAVAGRRS